VGNGRLRARTDPAGLRTVPVLDDVRPLLEPLQQEVSVDSLAVDDKRHIVCDTASFRRREERAKP
jgi:hypothetical protein